MVFPLLAATAVVYGENVDKTVRPALEITVDQTAAPLVDEKELGDPFEILLLLLVVLLLSTQQYPLLLLAFLTSIIAAGVVP